MTGAPAILEHMRIEDVIDCYPKTIPVFFRYGMHCVGCPMARFETLAEGAAIYGISVSALVAELNEAVFSHRKSL